MICCKEEFLDITSKVRSVKVTGSHHNNSPAPFESSPPLCPRLALDINLDLDRADLPHDKMAAVLYNI